MTEHHPDLALADLATSEEHAAASLLSVTAQWSDPTFSAQFDDGTAWVPVTAALPEAALSPGGALRRDLEAATSVARRLVAALSGGEQPSADAALPDLLREAAARTAAPRPCASAN